MATYINGIAMAEPRASDIMAEGTNKPFYPPLTSDTTEPEETDQALLHIAQEPDHPSPPLAQELVAQETDQLLPLAQDPISPDLLPLGPAQAPSQSELLQPLPLTRKNLALLDASYAIGKRKKHSSYFETESNTMTISSTALGFGQQQAYENGILDPTASRQPHDLGTLLRRLTQRRGSIQPSVLAHQQYCFMISKSYNQGGVTDVLNAEVLINPRCTRYGKLVRRAITRIPPQTFNYNLSPPEPDHLEGLWTDALPHHLHSHALHDDNNSLAFCHLAVEFKRADGNLHLARYQAAYDGAVLVYARNRALDHAATLGYSSREAVERAARETSVLTCVTDGKTVERFAHYCEGEQYHQYPVATENLLTYPNRGRELIRNAQEFAQRKSFELAALLGATL